MPTFQFTSNWLVNTTSAATVSAQWVDTCNWNLASFYQGYQFAGVTGTISVPAANSWIVYDPSMDDPGDDPIVRAPAIISEETRQRMAAEHAAHDQQMATETMRRQALQKEAKERARSLLLQHLTPDQRRSLEERHFFDLNIGGKHYRIRQGTHGNVRLVEGDREVRSFCAQPDDVPAEDAMLAQKLMLETDEAAFLRVANATQLTR